MALGDVLLYDDAVAFSGSEKFKLNSDGVGASINAGEFVLKGGVGDTAGYLVTKWGVSVTNKPSVGTSWLAGLAMSTSTDTATAGGTVEVLKPIEGLTYLVVPDTAATWDTQAEYDALVGARVKLSTSATGVQTLLATDGSSNGFVVEPLDVIKYPGKVRVSIRRGAVYNN